MRKFLILLVAAWGLAAVGIAHRAQPRRPSEGREALLRAVAEGVPGGSKAGSSWNMRVVGHDNLNVRGFNGDVWEHEGFAYVGHWGFADWATETPGSAHRRLTAGSL